MKTLATFMLFLTLLIDPTKIGKINTLKAEAKDAYIKGDFKTAIQKYRYLIDSLQVKEDEVLLNLANAYYQLNDTTNAINEYQSITQSNKKQLTSKAQQQLGVINNKQGKFEEALNHFKQAIKSDPANEDARYNYEMLKKKLEEKKKQEQQKQNQNKEDQKEEQEKKEDQQKDDQQKEQDKNKEQQQKDQQQKDQEKKDSEEQKKDQQKQEQEKEEQEQQKEAPPVSEKLKQMQISEQQAKKLLEAMRIQEVQYLQQNKRKATKPKDRGKPDW
jgi:Ca-activated chloride channel family protein